MHEVVYIVLIALSCAHAACLIGQRLAGCSSLALERDPHPHRSWATSGLAIIEQIRACRHCRDRCIAIDLVEFISIIGVHVDLVPSKWLRVLHALLQLRHKI